MLGSRRGGQRIRSPHPLVGAQIFYRRETRCAIRKLLPNSGGLDASGVYSKPRGRRNEFFRGWSEEELLEYATQGTLPHRLTTSGC